ncbi:MAG: hypothetical protein KTR15_01075 [Phycisphaeraceae bacterium]|nr:hypothetical protein [Phycisphaeraceae bacterium]
MSFYTTCPRLLALALILPLAGAALVSCSEGKKPAGPQGAEPEAPAQIAAETQAQPNGPTQPEHLVNPPADPRKALSQALDAGLLASDLSENDKLRAVLRVAGVPEASQVLVFSKTSLQLKLISPSNPRAIYFNDNCYIGYVPGGLVEYGDADPDPTIGSGMFAIDLREKDQAALTPDGSCLSCHDGARTNGRPGFFIRSVFPNPEGHVITSAGSTTVGHDTPLAKRWGGWYVTGNSGTTHHRGNQVTIEHPNGDAHIDNALGSNIDDLSHRFNVNRYLQPTSDIVALMVLEHQVQMHNRLTQGSAVVHEQYERSRSLAEYLEEEFEPSRNQTLQRVINSNAKRIVKHLLFCEEVALAEPIAGSDLFVEQFQANRKADRHGRSLKDFDLQTKIFKYRCSYMVYSHAYTLMHPLLKEAVSQKLQDVLEGRGDPSVYGHLEAAERQAILEILQETNVL